VTEHRTDTYDGHRALARAFRAESASECAALLDGTSEQFDAVREAMAAALGGAWSSVVVLVRRWHGLVDDVLAIASDERPDLVRRTDDHFGIVTASRTLSTEPVRYLDHLVGEVPFSPLVAGYGEKVGIGVVLIDAVRTLLPGGTPLRIDASPGWPDLPTATDAARYRRMVDLALRSMEPPLVRVRELFDLNVTELGDLFGVSRQAVEQWEQPGDVPAARREKMANVLAVGELLARKLSEGRLPLVARRPADVYGGLTMLEMVGADRDAELRELTERAFDWSGTA
jgi:DNA-binding transcriptional regulator YiaG